MKIPWPKWGQTDTRIYWHMSEEQKRKMAISCRESAEKRTCPACGRKGAINLKANPSYCKYNDCDYVDGI